MLKEPITKSRNKKTITPIKKRVRNPPSKGRVSKHLGRWWHNRRRRRQCRKRLRKNPALKNTSRSKSLGCGVCPPSSKLSVSAALLGLMASAKDGTRVRSKFLNARLRGSRNRFWRCLRSSPRSSRHERSPKKNPAGTGRYYKQN